MDDRRAVIAVDAGNTKTAAACIAADGRVLAHALVGRCNYQTTGPGPARDRLLEAVLPLAEAARAAGLVPAAWGLGLTGLDRPRDRAVLEGVIDEVQAAVAARVPVDPDPVRILVNDSFLVLRAGTDDGVGVAVLSGTGGNCVGVGRDGRALQIGGLSHELGDGGGASDIAVQALQACGRAKDGRGWATSLAPTICGVLGLDGIEDILDFAIPGNRPGGEDAEPPRVGLLAPLVFQAAADGDLVALRILMDTGADLGRSARAAAARLFRPDEAFPLVLGGTVLRHNPDSAFARAIVLETQLEFPRARPVPVDRPPLVGAALLGLDLLAGRPGGESLAAGLRDGSIRARLGEQLGAVM